MSKAAQMTEEQIQSLGFELVKQYEHSKYETYRYQKNHMEVEFTYERRELVAVDLTITELNCMPITFEKLKVLTAVLGEYKW